MEWLMLLAADVPTTPTSDNTGQYLVFFGGVIAVVGGIVVAYINVSRQEKPPPSAPVGIPDTPLVGALRERVAVNESELKGTVEDLDELAETVDVIDSRVIRMEVRQERIEKLLDGQFPGWH